MYRGEEKKRQSNVTFTLLSNDWCLYTGGSYFFCARTRFPAKQFLSFFAPALSLFSPFSVFFFLFSFSFFFPQPIADGNKSTRSLFEEELSRVYQAWENNWKRTRGYTLASRREWMRSLEFCFIKTVKAYDVRGCLDWFDELKLWNGWIFQMVEFIFV